MMQPVSMATPARGSALGDVKWSHFGENQVVPT